MLKKKKKKQAEKKKKSSFCRSSGVFPDTWALDSSGNNSTETGLMTIQTKYNISQLHILCLVSICIVFVSGNFRPPWMACQLSLRSAIIWPSTEFFPQNSENTDF